jgi:hypothetical protein
MATTLLEAALTHVVPEQVAREINDEHRAVGVAMRDSIAHARRAGDLLLDVKDKLPHGAFMEWVERHCEFAHRTATMYMRVAREWDRIATMVNWQSVANLGIAALDQSLSESGQDADLFVDPEEIAAEEAEWEAERERMRMDPNAHLTKWLWQQIGEGLGAVHDDLLRLQDHVGEGNPTVDQMIAVVERLDDERYRQEVACEEIGDAEAAGVMEADKTKMFAATTVA